MNSSVTTESTLSLRMHELGVEQDPCIYGNRSMPARIPAHREHFCDFFEFGVHDVGFLPNALFLFIFLR